MTVTPLTLQTNNSYINATYDKYTSLGTISAVQPAEAAVNSVITIAITKADVVLGGTGTNEIQFIIDGFTAGDVGSTGNITKISLTTAGANGQGSSGGLLFTFNNTTGTTNADKDTFFTALTDNFNTLGTVADNVTTSYDDGGSAEALVGTFTLTFANTALVGRTIVRGTSAKVEQTGMVMSVATGSTAVERTVTITGTSTGLSSSDTIYSSDAGANSTTVSSIVTTSGNTVLVLADFTGYVLSTILYKLTQPTRWVELTNTAGKIFNFRASDIRTYFRFATSGQSELDVTFDNNVPTDAAAYQVSSTNNTVFTSLGGDSNILVPAANSIYLASTLAGGVFTYQQILEAGASIDTSAMETSLTSIDSNTSATQTSNAAIKTATETTATIIEENA